MNKFPNQSLPEYDISPSERFRQNVHALSKNGVQLPPEIYHLSLEALPPVSGSLADGSLNIHLETDGFYGSENAGSYAQKQCDDFIKNPKRIEIFFRQKHQRTGLTTTDSLNAMHDFIAEQGLEVDNHIAPSDGDGQSLLILGAGLGLHIAPLITELTCLDLILIEPEITLLTLCLHYCDFRPILDLLAKRQGSLTIFYHPEVELLARNVKAHFDPWKTPLYDGSYIFTHYKSHDISFLQQHFSQSLPSHIGIPKGFWEDEEKMLENSYQNITSYHHQWLCNPYGLLRFSLAHIPCCIVGSGPSLDAALTHLRTVQEQAIIFSCGTALRVLLDNGVVPDFHCEIENTPGPAGIIKETATRHNISKIPLIAACTVDHRVPAFFDRRLFFMRDHLSCQYFFSSVPPTPMLSPTVTNLALRTAVGFGFHHIYLFGTDLGSRQTEVHHSQSSVYYKDPNFFKKNPYHQHAVKLPRQQPANFGGTAYTNENFAWAATFMHSLISDYKQTFYNTTVYNCSDGIAIEGTTPLLANRVSFSAKNPLLQQPKQTIVSALIDCGEPSFDKTSANLQEDVVFFTSLLKDCQKQILSYFANPWHERQAITDCWQQIMIYFKEQQRKDARFGHLLSCFYGGSLASLCSFALSGERRLAHDQKPVFRSFMQQLILDAICKNYASLEKLLVTLSYPNNDVARK